MGVGIVHLLLSNEVDDVDALDVVDDDRIELEEREVEPELHSPHQASNLKACFESLYTNPILHKSFSSVSRGRYFVRMSAIISVVCCFFNTALLSCNRSWTHKKTV